MSEVEITKPAILRVMRDPRNRNRKLWTPSVVLDRMGVYRWGEGADRYSRRDRLRVRRLLEELLDEDLVVVVKERHTLHSMTLTAEVAYGLPVEPGERRDG